MKCSSLNLIWIQNSTNRIQVMDCYIFRRENTGPVKWIRSSFRTSRLVRFANLTMVTIWSTYRYIDEMSRFAALEDASVSMFIAQSRSERSARGRHVVRTRRGLGREWVGGAPAAGRTPPPPPRRHRLTTPAQPRSFAGDAATVSRKQPSLYMTCIDHLFLFRN